MAGPAQLVQIVSDATGVPLPTIVDIDRRLVKAKLRTIGGRGLSAARMTPLDAARLLTAVLGSSQANAAADAVERYALTRPDKASSSEGGFAASELAELNALPARHSFVDALAALINSAAGGSLATLMAESDGWVPGIEVYGFTRAVRGRIRIAGMPNGRTASVEYESATVSKGRPPAKARRGASPDQGAGDLEQSRRITERTILSIAELFAAEDGK
jgi:hypothetical protein